MITQCFTDFTKLVNRNTKSYLLTSHNIFFMNKILVYQLTHFITWHSIYFLKDNRKNVNIGTQFFFLTELIPFWSLSFICLYTETVQQFWFQRIISIIKYTQVKHFMRKSNHALKLFSCTFLGWFVCSIKKKSENIIKWYKYPLTAQFKALEIRPAHLHFLHSP